MNQKRKLLGKAISFFVEYGVIIFGDLEVVGLLFFVVTS